MYGIIISFALTICLLIGERLVKKNNLDISTFWDGALCLILGGLIGARIYHVIDFWGYYYNEPIKILYVHEGGLGIYGALIGGFLGLSLYLSIKKACALPYLDVAAVITPLGQCIGRWGNFFNMEAFGTPTNLPWGLYIPTNLRPKQYLFNDMYHPIFFYESLLNLILFTILYYLYKHRNLQGPTQPGFKGILAKNGSFLCVYATGYGSIRFFLENVRINSWELLGINVAQFISAAFIAMGFIGLKLLYSTNKNTKK